jgi:hypothetical protein
VILCRPVTIVPKSFGCSELVASERSDAALYRQ